ncbi:hypothetical protein KBC04_00500 [Candidatus Babeliales bacterium]|nr:hypothetical protein [Candidatus Babeliales bacterium]MBP9843428.1 hypothetical protein [Candidatus Babeliales bacterium]
MTLKFMLTFFLLLVAPDFLEGSKSGKSIAGKPNENRERKESQDATNVKAAESTTMTQKAVAVWQSLTGKQSQKPTPAQTSASSSSGTNNRAETAPLKSQNKTLDLGEFKESSSKTANKNSSSHSNEIAPPPSYQEAGAYKTTRTSTIDLFTPEQQVVAKQKSQAIENNPQAKELLNQMETMMQLKEVRDQAQIEYNLAMRKSLKLDKANSKASAQEKKAATNLKNEARNKFEKASEALKKQSKEVERISDQQFRDNVKDSLGLNNPSQQVMIEKTPSIIAKIKESLGFKPTAAENKIASEAITKKAYALPKLPTTLEVRQFIQDCIDTFSNLRKPENQKTFTRLSSDGTTAITQNITNENQQKEVIVTHFDQQGKVITKKSRLTDKDGYLIIEQVTNEKGKLIEEIRPHSFGNGKGGLDTHQYTYHENGEQASNTRTRIFNNGKRSETKELDRNNQPIIP